MNDQEPIGADDIWLAIEVMLWGAVMGVAVGVALYNWHMSLLSMIAIIFSLEKVAALKRRKEVNNQENGRS